MVLTDSDGNRYDWDNFTTQHYLDGHAPGLERGCKWLIDKAQQLFLNGQYDEAKNLRELAVEMSAVVKAKLEQEALAHSRNHPSKLSSEP